MQLKILTISFLICITGLGILDKYGKDPFSYSSSPTKWQASVEIIVLISGFVILLNFFVYLAKKLQSY